MVEIKSKTQLSLDSFKTETNDMNESTIKGKRCDVFKRSVSCIENTSLHRRKLLTKSTSKCDLKRTFGRSVSMDEHRHQDKLRHIHSVDLQLNSEIFKRSSTVKERPEDDDDGNDIQNDKMDEEEVEIGSVSKTMSCQNK